MEYDPRNYETVKERKERFYKSNPDGRIIVKNITPADQLLVYALFEATIYKSKEDQQNNLPVSTGYAMEIRDTEKKVSKYGKEYESVNYSSWTENAEESCIGRALDNAGFSGNKKCSREEIEKADRMIKTIDKSNAKTYKLNNDNFYCETCKKGITEAEHTYSKGKFNQSLCRTCQNLIK